MCTATAAPCFDFGCVQCIAKSFGDSAHPGAISRSAAALPPSSLLPATARWLQNGCLERESRQLGSNALGVSAPQPPSEGAGDSGDS